MQHLIAAYNGTAKEYNDMSDKFAQSYIATNANIRRIYGHGPRSLMVEHLSDDTEITEEEVLADSQADRDAEEREVDTD